MGVFIVCVDISEMRVRWDKNHNFSNNVQSYVDGTDFFGISEKINIVLAGENDYTVTSTNILPRTLKPSQKIAHDVIVQAAVQPGGTSCMENENNIIFLVG